MILTRDEATVAANRARQYPPGHGFRYFAYPEQPTLG